MIIFDANVLIALGEKDSADDLSNRIGGLIHDLIAENTVIGIPAPAWAEYLCGAGVSGGNANVVEMLAKRSAVRILPFDEMAATGLAAIEQSTRAFGPKRGASNAGWQKVKIDRQILAITRVHAATVIYSDDEALGAEANRMALAVRRTRDIPHARALRSNG
jgi:predicted nucleic acid-binding protein